MATMSDRRGEKIGWLGGWSGGFLWVAILAIVFAFQGRFTEAFVSAGIAALAFSLVFATAPWKYPRTQYWKLMLPLYAMLVVSVAVLLWAFGSFSAAGFNQWSFFWLLPALTPFWTIGKRTWSDNAA